MVSVPERLRRWALDVRIYGGTLIKWLAVSLVIGGGCGLLGSAFHIGVELATEYRLAHPWVLWLLPLGGLAAVGVYKLFRAEGRNTDSVIEVIQQGRDLPIGLLPSIFIATVITHLCGGSAGREGAALQMGGTIGFAAGKVFRLDERDLRTATMTGMAAFFSALFGTPLAATVFAMAVISVGLLYHAAFLPCFTASLAAYGVSLLLGVEPTRFAVASPGLELPMLLRVAVLSSLCAFLSVLFCETIHQAEHIMKRLVKNVWLRAAAGGVLLIALTMLTGSHDYNGAGMNVIAAAVEEGRALPPAFAWKLLFTAITLAAGFKGGEVVPSFFVGATFGCVVGPLLGIPAGFAAAIGLISVFCGAVNCPLASIFLAEELFGAEGMLYFALACGLSFVLSGYSGIYSSQKILYDKLKARYINIHTNARHAGGEPEN